MMASSRAIERVLIAVAVTTLAALTSAQAAPDASPGASRATTKPKAPPPRVEAPAYGGRADVLAFVDELVAHGAFDRGALLQTLAGARYSATSARLMQPSVAGGTRRDWNVERARFVDPVRLAAGFRFWEDNAVALARAEAEFGVPAEVIVGILGVETVYGRNTGSFRVLDVLSTLAFDFPRGGRDRSAFFREQLADALAMDRDGAVDLATLRGSYAGAIGMPQFMPGSIQQFAIDYDGDGRIDLVGSPADVIGSVANFLARHGWIRGLPTRVALAHPDPVDAVGSARIAAMVDAGSVPSIAFVDLADAGFVADALPPAEPLALIDLPAGTDASGAPRTSYVAGTRNFHVITRYNHSYFYAMSVIELGETIKALREARPSS
jgi:membrane-bound lytic murein transglycosylase B